MNKFLSSVALIALLTTGVSGMAHAQTTSDTPAAAVPSPDGVDQVNQRLQDQQKRIDKAVSEGKITPDQAARDKKTDAKVADKLAKDQAKNGGTITKREQEHLNKKLDKNHHRIHHQMKKTKASTPAVTPAPASPPVE
jgi:coenzyme F420-reducing hydrogenase beta subunit